MSNDDKLHPSTYSIVVSSYIGNKFLFRTRILLLIIYVFEIDRLFTLWEIRTHWLSPEIVENNTWEKAGIHSFATHGHTLSIMISCVILWSYRSYIYFHFYFSFPLLIHIYFSLFLLTTVILYYLERKHKYYLKFQIIFSCFTNKRFFQRWTPPKLL